MQPSVNFGCLFWDSRDTHRLTAQCELILLEVINHMALCDKSTCPFYNQCRSAALDVEPSPGAVLPQNPPHSRESASAQDDTEPSGGPACCMLGCSTAAPECQSGTRLSRPLVFRSLTVPCKYKTFFQGQAYGDPDEDTDSSAGPGRGPRALPLFFLSLWSGRA